MTDLWILLGLSRRYSALSGLGCFVAHGEAELYVSGQIKVHIWRHL